MFGVLFTVVLLESFLGLFLLLLGSRSEQSLQTRHRKLSVLVGGLGFKLTVEAVRLVCGWFFLPDFELCPWKHLNLPSQFQGVLKTTKPMQNLR